MLENDIIDIYDIAPTFKKQYEKRKTTTTLIFLMRRNVNNVQMSRRS